MASGEGSFCKLKLIKSYLRLVMSQERLSNLAVISLEKEFLNRVYMKELSNQFAKITMHRRVFNELSCLTHTTG